MGGFGIDRYIMVCGKWEELKIWLIFRELVSLCVNLFYIFLFYIYFFNSYFIQISYKSK